MKKTCWTPLLIAALLMLLLQGCASLPPPSQSRQADTSIAASTGTALGRIAAQSVPAGESSAFRPLPLSAYSMDARLALARHAQSSLDLQYYLLQNDVTGHVLLQAVKDAALRGVRVRVLVDDMYTADSDGMLLALAAYPNVQVRLFNPFPAGRAFASTRWAFSLLDFSRVNHRMHNKMFIADGAFAVAGGRNIANEYFFHDKEGNFLDFDLLLAGAAVPKMQAIFDTYWNSPHVYPLHEIEVSRETPQALRDSFDKLVADGEAAYPTPPPDSPDLLGYRPLSGDLSRPVPLKMLYGHVDVFADNPEKVGGRAEQGDDASTVTARLIEAMRAARSDIALSTPYFIPGQRGLALFGELRQAGRRISLLTNSLSSNDEPFASAAYARYRVPMLKLGVEIDEVDASQLKQLAMRTTGVPDDEAGAGDAKAASGITASSLKNAVGRSHAKLLVIDRRRSFVGSMNMDLRSSRLNTELGLIIDSPALAKDIFGLIDGARASGTYHLRLLEPGDRLQWISTGNGTEEIHDHEPEVGLGTRLQLLFFFPFVSEGLL
ncbi:phospholipase D family protein [Variovorax sp. 160MFSha2.1]|uniref:phospholipase D family protein n=1 Tax=Variovorax sp. 160MFSha2.1 TaxID=3158367 RepID=UPI003AAA754E